MSRRMVWLLFVFFVFPALGESLDLGWKPARLEIWLAAPDRTLQEKASGLILLSEKYLEDGRVQEAIWTLRSGAQYEQAAMLEAELEKRLENSPLIFTENLPGKDQSTKYKVGQGRLYGVFKSQLTSESYLKEVAAYRLDRLLGLNLVPITVFRHYPDHVKGSLQYFVRGAKQNAHWSSNEAEFRRTGYPGNQKDMWLLDYLIDNQDRHGMNWIRRYGNQAVAIDQGTSFGEIGFRSVEIQEELLPTGRILENLRNMKPSDFSDLDLDFTKMFERRDQILELIERDEASYQGIWAKVLCRELLLH